MHNKYALIKYFRNLTVKYLYKIKKKSSMPFSFQFAKFKYFGLLEMCHEYVKVVIILDVAADQPLY